MNRIALLNSVSNHSPEKCGFEATKRANPQIRIHPPVLSQKIKLFTSPLFASIFFSSFFVRVNHRMNLPSVFSTSPIINFVIFWRGLFIDSIDHYIHSWNVIEKNLRIIVNSIHSIIILHIPYEYLKNFNALIVVCCQGSSKFYSPTKACGTRQPAKLSYN